MQYFSTDLLKFPCTRSRMSLWASCAHLVAAVHARPSHSPSCFHAHNTHVTPIIMCTTCRGSPCKTLVAGRWMWSLQLHSRIVFHAVVMMLSIKAGVTYCPSILENMLLSIHFIAAIRLMCRRMSCFAEGVAASNCTAIWKRFTHVLSHMASYTCAYFL